MPNYWFPFIFWSFRVGGSANLMLFSPSQNKLHRLWILNVLKLYPNADMAHCLTSVGHCGYFCRASMIWVWSSVSLMSWYSLWTLAEEPSTGRISSSCCRCSNAYRREEIKGQSANKLYRCSGNVHFLPGVGWGFGRKDWGKEFRSVSTNLHDNRLLKVVHGVGLPMQELLKLWKQSGTSEETDGTASSTCVI